MLIDEKKIKLWSTIGPRATLGLACLELVKEVNNFMVLTCDISTSAGLDRFRKIYPNNYLDLGIAEQNMIGVGAGLSSEGYNVLTTTFAPFQTARCCEQIKVNAGYMKQKICMVGIASGLVLGNLGFTHCSIEDVGILRSIPNLNILSPSDSLEVVKCLTAAVKSDQSFYIRLTGATNNPVVNKQDYDFKIGKSIELKKGDDTAIFASGASVYNSLQASEELKKHKVDASVINMHTIKPIDADTLKKASDRYKIIFSVEEHNIIGGLGSAIAEEITKLKKIPRLIKIGINDKYSKGGSYEYLKQNSGLTKDKIVETILKNL